MLRNKSRPRAAKNPRQPLALPKEEECGGGDEGDDDNDSKSIKNGARCSEIAENHWEALSGAAGEDISSLVSNFFDKLAKAFESHHDDSIIALLESCPISLQGPNGVLFHNHGAALDAFENVVLRSDCSPTVWDRLLQLGLSPLALLPGKKFRLYGSRTSGFCDGEAVCHHNINNTSSEIEDAASRLPPDELSIAWTPLRPTALQSRRRHGRSTPWPEEYPVAGGGESTTPVILLERDLFNHRRRSRWNLSMGMGNRNKLPSVNLFTLPPFTADLVPVAPPTSPTTGDCSAPIPDPIADSEVYTPTAIADGSLSIHVLRRRGIALTICEASSQLSRDTVFTTLLEQLLYWKPRLADEHLSEIMDAYLGSLLHWTCQFGSASMVYACLVRAAVHDCNLAGRFALHRAVLSARQPEMKVRCLLDFCSGDRQVKVNVQQSAPHVVGVTPLLLAVQKGSLMMTRFLLEAGADCNIEAPSLGLGVPLSHAVYWGHAQLVALICKYGNPDFSLKCSTGESPITTAENVLRFCGTPKPSHILNLPLPRTKVSVCRAIVEFLYGEESKQKSNGGSRSADIPSGDSITAEVHDRPDEQQPQPGFATLWSSSSDSSFTVASAGSPGSLDNDDEEAGRVPTAPRKCDIPPLPGRRADRVEPCRADASTTGTRDRLEPREAAPPNQQGTARLRNSLKKPKPTNCRAPRPSKCANREADDFSCVTSCAPRLAGSSSVTHGSEQHRTFATPTTATGTLESSSSVISIASSACIPTIVAAAPHRPEAINFRLESASVAAAPPLQRGQPMTTESMTSSIEAPSRQRDTLSLDEFSFFVLPEQRVGPH